MAEKLRTLSLTPNRNFLIQDKECKRPGPNNRPGQEKVQIKIIDQGQINDQGECLANY